MGDGRLRSCQVWVTSSACVIAAFVRLCLSFKCLAISPVVALVSVMKDGPKVAESRCLRSGVPGFTDEEMAREAQALNHSVDSGTRSLCPVLRASMMLLWPEEQVGSQGPGDVYLPGRGGRRGTSLARAAVRKLNDWVEGLLITGVGKVTQKW